MTAAVVVNQNSQTRTEEDFEWAAIVSPVVMSSGAILEKQEIPFPNLSPEMP
jgi:hypothetical protein